VDLAILVESRGGAAVVVGSRRRQPPAADLAPTTTDHPPVAGSGGPKARSSGERRRRPVMGLVDPWMGSLGLSTGFFYFFILFIVAGMTTALVNH